MSSFLHLESVLQGKPPWQGCNALAHPSCPAASPPQLRPPPHLGPCSITTSCLLMPFTSTQKAHIVCHAMTRIVNACTCCQISRHAPLARSFCFHDAPIALRVSLPLKALLSRDFRRAQHRLCGRQIRIPFAQAGHQINRPGPGVVQQVTSGKASCPGHCFPEAAYQHPAPFPAWHASSSQSGMLLGRSGKRVSSPSSISLTPSMLLPTTRPSCPGTSSASPLPVTPSSPATPSPSRPSCSRGTCCRSSGIASHR